jgi:aspartate kinase
MKVFKFGGASVKDSAGVKNVALILQNYTHEKVTVVISAMGKTTNALERVLNLYHSRTDHRPELILLKEYHAAIMRDLFPTGHAVWSTIENLWAQAEQQLDKQDGDADRLYDQVVSFGEIISTQIVFHYLTEQGLPVQWADARTYIATDHTWREGKVDWKRSCDNIKGIKNLLLLEKNILITQGFIGQTPDGYTTTLGRDGSDFSAAIFASCLQAESVTIWKDVPGVMNADPKRMSAAIVFHELPFREAAEMTYYGASVIHPKTIKPLANNNIPLFVKSFDNPSLTGTKIHECHVDSLPPLIVYKDNQCLISCKVTDYTFVTEDHMSKIFHALTELNIHLNLMQNSAISFSFCIDFRENKVKALIEKLRKFFEVYYNTGLTLVTIKNYDENTFETFRKKPGVLLEQSSRSTLQVLLKTVNA